MSLGKRPRPPPMKRTTSLSEFAADLIALDLNPNPHPNLDPIEAYLQRRPHPKERQREAMEAAIRAVPQAVDLSAAVESAEFLRACGLCKRRLGPGRDTFIYRGEAAFCSLECREKRISLDERKERCSHSSMKSDAPPPKARSAANGGGGTVAAA